MKKFTMTNHRGEKVDFWRVSRWISVKTNYNPNKRNSLWDFVSDDYGRHPNNDGFDPSEGLELRYFRYDGRTYAIDQFYGLGSMWVCEEYTYTEDGETKGLHAVDMYGDLFRPIYLEWDEDGERVRVYERA